MEVKEALRSKAGYGAILALGIFLSALILATFILLAMVPSSRVSSEASGSAREAFEQKREGLRVFVWSYYYGSGSGGVWQRPYLYLVAEGGFSALVRDVLFLRAQNRLAIDPVTGQLVREYRLDRVVEPPCLMIRLDKLNHAWKTIAAFNRSVTHVSVVSEGKAYYGTLRRPNATLAYACVPDVSRNSSDLRIIATQAVAINQTSWRVVKGICQLVERHNQIRLRCAAYSVVELVASDTNEYVFEEWEIEGESVKSRQVTIALDDDYDVKARFRRR
jgi:hypothetical protein